MDIYESRRQLVLKILRERFNDSRADFAEATGISRSYVTRMLAEPGKAGRKRIAEDMARKMEELLGLPAGWLDQPFDRKESVPSGEKQVTWPFEAAKYSDFLSLPDKFKHRLDAYVEMKLHELKTQALEQRADMVQVARRELAESTDLPAEGSASDTGASRPTEAPRQSLGTAAGPSPALPGRGRDTKSR